MGKLSLHRAKWRGRMNRSTVKSPKKGAQAELSVEAS